MPWLRLVSLRLPAPLPLHSPLPHALASLQARHGLPQLVYIKRELLPLIQIEGIIAYPLCGSRRRPILPDRFQSSTFGAKRLNFCVRYGYRWNPLAIVTGIS